MASLGAQIKALMAMDVEILGTESLGVRGLCCVVTVENRKIVIDPGLALGYQRHGLLPHPAQVAVGEQICSNILVALEDATDVVMSHFHGDHVPLLNANPYQLKAQEAIPLCRAARFWMKGSEGLSHNMMDRRQSIADLLGKGIAHAEGKQEGPLTFSKPMPHGEQSNELGTVMMTRIESGGSVFVHASDIQLLGDEAVSMILAWEPSIVLVGGPPLYLDRLSSTSRISAWENAQRLAYHVETLILDHHLLRNEEGLSWLDRLSSETGRRVICAADYMGCRRCLLEAWREQLYEEMPVPEGWHDGYAKGESDTRRFQAYREACGSVWGAK
jgi:predicted metallo-beta-lactamase superfamily hydrolase